MIKLIKTLSIFSFIGTVVCMIAIIRIIFYETPVFAEDEQKINEQIDNKKTTRSDTKAENIKSTNKRLIKSNPNKLLASVSLPLSAQDYYFGKFINAKVAVNEINSIPILIPGDKISLISDNYLTFDQSKGYIDPDGTGSILYASGTCWSVSTLGSAMDQANIEFEKQYGLPLFVFTNGDRIPHNQSYLTYQTSNNGYGYTVSKVGNVAGADYKFTINPELANDSRFDDLEIQIKLEGNENDPNGYLGQAIEGTVLINI